MENACVRLELCADLVRVRGQTGQEEFWRQCDRKESGRIAQGETLAVDDRKPTGNAFRVHIVVPEYLAGKAADVGAPERVQHFAKGQAGRLGVVFVAEVVVEVCPREAYVFA